MTPEHLTLLYFFGSFLLLLFVAAIAVMVLKQRQRRQRYRIAIRELEYRHENELLKTAIEVQEQALNWISREIHDDINQSLSIIGIQMQHAAENKTCEEKTAVMQEMVGEIGNCIARLRNLCHMSSGAMIQEMGLVESIGKELRHIRSVCKQHCEFNHPGKLPPLSDNAVLLLFRITQEALFNITRHAKATSAAVTLAGRKNKLVLQISDNGKGILPEEKNTGLGLMNMRQRAKLLDGELSIDTTPGRGTKITITVPLSAVTDSMRKKEKEQEKIKHTPWIKRSLQ